VKRIAVFAEGQTEQIFVRHLLLKMVDNSRLSFECMKLGAGGNERPVPWPYSAPDPDIYFLIVDCGNDGKVLSVIRDREESLVAKGFEKIIGIRDMYSAEYDKRSPGVIDDSVITAFITNWNLTISKMTHADKISFHAAIMEVEAWLLGMHGLFQRVDPLLSSDFIENKLGFNLKAINPEKKFYKPSGAVAGIMQLCGKRYRKKKGDCEGIASKIELEDFVDATENSRCKSLGRFYLDMTACTAVCGQQNY
jgi:hypothetical protein